MTQEDKELLLKDLSGRLPYNVKCQFEDTIRVIDGESEPFYDYILSARHLDLFINHANFYIRPYLRPMSSMTEEELADYESLEVQCKVLPTFAYISVSKCVIFDWLNEHHFDYRNLIGHGLALEAPEGMYKTE